MGINYCNMYYVENSINTSSVTCASLGLTLFKKVLAKKFSQKGFHDDAIQGVVPDQCRTHHMKNSIA